MSETVDLPAIPRDFSEAGYLAANPDVAAAVAAGAIESGANHWLSYGWREGRPLGGTRSDGTLPAAPKFSKSEYKALWNACSESEDAAKFVVSGYTDEELYKETARGTLSVLQTLVGIRPDDIVLEIGAGVGRVGALVAPLCREWIGVDVSENMVGHIQRRLAGFANVRAIASSGFDLPEISSKSIDMVYCTVVFMHLEEWDRYNYIVEGFRILKPGGRMLVDNVNLLTDEGWKFFEEHRTIPPGDRPPNISTTSTPQELEAYFRRAGFCDIGQDSAGIWLFTFGKKPTVSDPPSEQK